MKRSLIPKGYEGSVLWIGVYCITLFLVGGIDLLPQTLLPHTTAVLIQFVCYCLMVGAWTLSSAARLYHPRVRLLHGLLCTAFFVILVLSRMRHVVMEGIYPWENIMWYLFYLPTMAIPLLSFYMTQYVGRDEAWRMPGKLKLLVIPGVILLAGILTNEWHELAFVLDQSGVPVSVAGHYSVSWLYFLAQAWYLLFTALSLVRLIRVCREHDLRIFILPQAVVVFLGILYTVLYALDRSPTGFGYLEPAIVSCSIAIGVWEASLLTGMIPNNRGHALFFHACTVPMELMDNGGSIRFVSAGRRQEGRIYRTRTKTFPEGSIRYQEDVTELEETLAALFETEKTMREANRKLEADAQVRERLARTAERNRLYDRALADTKERVEGVRAGADGMALSHTEQRNRIGYISVPLAYIKRRVNLVLTEEASGDLPVSELHFCLRETVEALSLIPVSVLYTQETDDAVTLSAKTLKKLYDAFEDAVEEVLPQLEQMRLVLKATAQEVTVAMEMEGNGMEPKRMTLSAERERSA